MIHDQAKITPQLSKTSREKSGTPVQLGSLFGGDFRHAIERRIYFRQVATKKHERVSMPAAVCAGSIEVASRVSSLTCTATTSDFRTLTCP